MTLDQWLSVKLPAEHHSPYQQGAFSTIEAAGPEVIAVLRRSNVRPGRACMKLRTADSDEEARVVATMLRMLNPI